MLLELGLEACACLSVDLGVASGSVSIAVGVYLRLEADKGLLTAYFRVRGEVSVLGLISASITLELSLTYHFETGKLLGRALAGRRGRGAVLLRFGGDLGGAQARRLQGATRRCTR